MSHDDHIDAEAYELDCRQCGDDHAFIFDAQHPHRDGACAICNEPGGSDRG